MRALIFLCLVTFILNAGNSVTSLQRYHTFILKAEKRATLPALKVMQQVREMVENHVVILGSCWDYLDYAFHEAGYSRGSRVIIYKAHRDGPYTSASKISTGDWLYFINHSYHNREHSGLFIGWTNYSKRQGLIMSYAGEHRAEPARYKIYDLHHVYSIIRAK